MIGANEQCHGNISIMEVRRLVPDLKIILLTAEKKGYKSQLAEFFYTYQDEMGNNHIKNKYLMFKEKLDVGVAFWTAIECVESLYGCTEETADAFLKLAKEKAGSQNLSIEIDSLFVLNIGKIKPKHEYYLTHCQRIAREYPRFLGIYKDCIRNALNFGADEDLIQRHLKESNVLSDR